VATPRSPLSREERAQRRRARSETLAWLKETYPALMVPPLPLPIGFGDLAFVRAQDAGHSLFAVSAIKFHCNGIANLEALAAEGAMRCDLDGIPLEPVAAKHQAFAKNRVAEIAAKRGAAKLPNDWEVSTHSNSQPQR
jgi:sRNA-binding protein